MATIRLVPSTYTRSNTNYTNVADADNMYENTDDTSDYASLRGRNRNSSTNYYIFIHGFNTGSVPSGATVTSFSVKIRAYRSSNQRTGTNTRLRLASTPSSGSVISNTTMSSDIGTTQDVYTIPTGNLDWDDIAGYGSNFSIEVPVSSNSSSYPYVYVYGAEIEVTYTLPNPRTITTTLTGNGTIDPSGTETYYDGDEYNLTIVPADSGASVSATKNGVAITLTHHQAGTQTKTATADSLTTGFSGGSNMAFYTSSSSTGHNFNYAVGHTAESPGSTSSGSGSWTYVKDNGSSTSYTGYADFVFDFSDIPSNATINSVTVKCYGAQEDSSQTTGHADITLYSGTTQKGTMQEFTSSSNSIITLSNVGTWTAEELHEAKLRFVVGYYGGHIFGITWTVSYTAPEYYSYSYEVDGNATIAVVIGGSVATVYMKVGNSWTPISKVYKKINGSWVQQTDISNVFQSGVNYKYGGG